MIIVSDTSPIIALVRINKLNLLRRLFGEIIVSKQVYSELVKFKNKIGVSKIKKTRWIKIVQAQNEKQIIKLQKENVSQADASSIVLALELEAILLADDLKVRQIAKKKNLSVIGTISVLLVMQEKGIIHNVQSILKKLYKSNFRIGSELYEKIKEKF